MKKLFQWTIIIGLMIISNINSQAQVSTPFNNGIVGNYSGWNGGQNFPFMIRHQARQQIQFFTDSIFCGVIDSASGFWGVGTPRPLSVLHVDTITNASAGEIFRTVGTANTQVFWRMFRGSFEYGRIYNRNDNDLYVQAPGGNMRLYAGSSQRVFIEDNGSGSASGYVAIGNGFSNPASRLHVSQGNDQPVYFQMTGNNTNGTATDGLRIGVLNPSGGLYDVEIRQQEAAPMKFFTGDNTAGTHYEQSASGGLKSK